MNKPFRAEYRGETPCPDETFEEFVGLDAPEPRARPILKSIPFVLAGVLLIAAVTVFGNFVAQNSASNMTSYASMTSAPAQAISPPAVSLVGKTAFRTDSRSLE